MWGFKKKSHSFYGWLSFGIVASFVSFSNGETNPFKHTRVLDTEGKYVLEWEVDWEAVGGAEVIFKVTVETRGWVGLGLSMKGLMNGSDIVVGGIGANGKPYFSDRHGVGNSRPVLDDRQDWTLLKAWESHSHTFLSFSRKLETCDKTQDIAITEDLLNFIWAYGEIDDENEWHHQRRGSMDSYILDPDLTPKIVTEQRWRNVTRPREFNKLGHWNVWGLNIPYVMPAQDTTYICTMHKAPTRRKHHVVGFRPVLPTELERKHIHHIVMHKCQNPPGVDPNKVFGRFVGGAGEECYLFTRPDRMPVQYCQEVYYEWAIGGGPAFFPDHVGMAMTADSSEEYYVVQTHYDNPDILPNLRIDLRLELFYTDKLREYDGGIINAGVKSDHYSNLVPPHSLDHFIYGFCSKGCTNKMFPKEGVNVFSTRAHTHIAGTRNRLMVIRGKDRTEKPIYIDDNYNFNYQEYRTRREEIKLFPGDIIYHRCNLQTTNRINATVGGFSTRNEMCHGWMWFYPYQKNTHCQSEIRSDAYREFLNVYNTTFSNERREYIVLSPPINAGLSVQESATRINWSLDNRRQLQTHQRFLPQVSICEDLDPIASDRAVANLQRIEGTLPTLNAYQSFSNDNHPYYYQQQPRLPSIIEPDHKGTAFTELDKEIQNPRDEFLHLWPSDVKWYSRPSICPKN